MDGRQFFHVTKLHPKKKKKRKPAQSDEIKLKKKKKKWCIAIFS
jgi:hypothetical protein